MEYIVVKDFCDATDNGRFYRKGDFYPAEGVRPTKARINALLTGQNRAKTVFIRAVEPEAEIEGGES